MGRPRSDTCPAGHAKRGRNVYVDGKGHRRCRKCTLARNKAWVARQKPDK